MSWPRSSAAARGEEAVEAEMKAWTLSFASAGRGGQCKMFINGKNTGLGLTSVRHQSPVVVKIFAKPLPWAS